MTTGTCTDRPGAPRPPFADPRVGAAFAAFPERARSALLRIRGMIFDIADDLGTVGPVHEALKWGQPAYLTQVTGAGTTIRLAVPKTGGCAVLVHCQTSLIGDLRAVCPDTLRYDGNRGVVFDTGEPPNENALRMLIRSALTYHQR